MFPCSLSFLKNISLLMLIAVSANAQLPVWKKEFQNKLSNITIIDEKVAVFEYNYRFGLISIKKDTLIPPVYENINLVTKLSRAIVGQHSKSGVMDFNGRVIIPLV